MSEQSNPGEFSTPAVRPAISTESQESATGRKTPMFEAIHSGRYERKSRIRTIQERTKRALICYICGPAASIERDDAVFFVDLLHSVDKDANVDLMLHTGGGDIDAAEKLISLVRSRIGQKGHLRVVVPDYAKSAGTLMALGADLIVMSDASELGPIDPQITLDDGRGNRIRHSVLSYLDAYQEHAGALRKNPADAVAHVMLSKLDPATVKVFEAVKKRSLLFAENQLKFGMFRFKSGNYTRIASALMDAERWQTHGQMIGWEAAQGIELLVEYMDPMSDGWQDYWRLYCHQRLAIKDGGKLFESEQVSLIEGGAE